MIDTKSNTPPANAGNIFKDLVDGFTNVFVLQWVSCKKKAPLLTKEGWRRFDDGVVLYSLKA
jgi:hypothetical protein